MSAEKNEGTEAEVSSTTAIDQVQIILEDFFDTADVGRVYGRPVKSGDTVVLPTAEVLTAVGFGMGHGEGSGMEENPASGSSSGSGGGGGGGGRTLSRPVAVVVASPAGVHIEPVVDITKVALAGITAVGFMFSFLLRMKKGPG
jgi:uncharacterized spore protein YtfJ